MHEEATSMSVPCSVAVSTSHNQNGTTAPLVSVVTADVDLEVSQDHHDNVELEVPFSTNSGGNFQNAVTGGFYRL